MNKYRVSTHPLINQFQWKISKRLEQNIDLSKYSTQFCTLLRCNNEELDFKIPQIIGIIKLGQISRLAFLEFKLLIQQSLIEAQINGQFQNDLDFVRDIIIFIELNYLQSEDEKFLPDSMPSSLSPLKAKLMTTKTSMRKDGWKKINI
ncbi:unnamed protein product [Paramecium primaurelia]|uniref:Uncharacterized protein n=2 Tax=Paramecium TaxID=5884 RepID=A0A8S1U6N3_9CILI|nr:unnamed protein product [Paramecium primaurelia]CAD8159009.1 unnamed protein product [Paramecium pentaurelia]